MLMNFNSSLTKEFEGARADLSVAKVIKDLDCSLVQSVPSLLQAVDIRLG